MSQQTQAITLQDWPVHYGPSLWLFFCLIISAYAKTGGVIATLETLSEFSGLGEKLTQQALDSLKEWEYIDIENMNDNHIRIQILKWGTMQAFGGLDNTKTAQKRQELYNQEYFRGSATGNRTRV